jgi:hypothetical protein
MRLKCRDHPSFGRCDAFALHVATPTVRGGPKGDPRTLVFRRSHSAAVRPKRHEPFWAWTPVPTEFRIVYGAVPSDNKEIALISRSIFEVLLDISSTIVVPETHVMERRATATAEVDLGS